MIKLGIRKPVTTLMLIIAIVIFAVVSFPRVPVELYPNYQFGEISVITRLRGGIPATEVEKAVTRPMEEVFSEVNGLKEITSASRESESVIVLNFQPNINLNFATLDVREKLASIKHRLPREVEKPIIAKYSQSDTPVIIIALSSESLSPEQLRVIAEEKIKEKIMRVGGVANIEIGGGQERKILIDIDNARLLSYNLPITSVVQLINTTNISVSAGNVEKAGDRYIVRATGEYTNVKEIENTGIGITPSGSIVRLRDIATVRDSFYEPSSFARLNIKAVVSLYIQKESSANTITVGKKIQEQVEELRKTYANDMTITIIKNDAEFIQNAVSSLELSVLEGGVLVAAILFLFLRNVRTIAIIISTLPVSLLLSVVLMYFGGLSFNIMTMSGLAMGLGNLMDNAIVILENLSYHYRKKTFKDHETLVIEGTKELIMPITASTISTVIVFLPLIFLDPEIKRLYVPFGLAIALSLFSALIGTLIFVPPLCFRVKNAFTFSEPVWFKPIVKKYLLSLKYVLRHQKMFFVAVMGLFLFSLYLFSGRSSEFIEPGEANTFRLGIQFPPGTRIERSNETVRKIEKALLSMQGVERVSSRVEKLHTFVEVNVKQDKTKIKEEFRESFKEYSPAFLYYQESNEASSREVFVEFYGYDYGVLKQIAYAVSGKFSAVKGLSDIKIRMREDEPEINLMATQDRLAHFGITTFYMSNALHNMLRGLVATYYRSEGKEIEAIARLEPGTVRTSEDLPYLRMVLPSGYAASLNQLTEIRQVTTAQEIWHKNKKRFIQISVNRGKMGLTECVDKLKKTLGTVKFPKDYSYNFSGDYEKTIKSKRDFTLALMLTVILIYMTLASLYESYTQPFLIMLSLPLSVMGVAYTLKIFNMSISLGVWIGMMILGGIVVNSAIIMVEKMNLVKESGRNTVYAVIESSRERFKPVLMTSLNNIIGLLPLVLNRDEAATMWRSLALTVMGGMLSGTFLTLYMIPAAYLLLDKVSDSKAGTIPGAFIGIYKGLLKSVAKLKNRIELLRLRKNAA